MRLVLALSILAAGAVSAHAAEDRYGPPRAAVATSAGPQATGALPASGAPYGGQMLSWSGKTPGPAPTPAVASAPALPQPIAPWAGQAPTPQRVSYPSIAAPVQPAPQPAFVPQAPARQAAAPQPLPTSLYDRPAAPPAQAYAPPPVQQPVQQPSPQPARQAVVQPTLQPLPAPQQPTQPYQAPRGQAASLPPPPSTPTRMTAGPEDARPRAYSVLREFGGTPDPINIPPPTSYWATRPETAPPPEDASADFDVAGGVGAAEVASADRLDAEELAAKRRERDEKRERAAAAAKDSGK